MVLRRVAEAASKAGDIRVGFSILLTAGYLAERDGRGKIGLEDLETAAKAAEIRLDLGVVYVNAGRTRSPYYTMPEILGHPPYMGGGGGL